MKNDNQRNRKNNRLRIAFLPAVAAGILCGLPASAELVVSAHALRALRDEADKLTTVERAVDFAFNFRHRGIRFTPSQVREEITGFLKLLSQRPPAAVLEIGTEKGGTFSLLTRVAAPDALLVSLDLPAGQDSAYPAWREPLYRGFAWKQQRVEIIREDSHGAHAFERMKQLFAGCPLDLLFIDGDHSYEGVKKDFETYSALVAKGGTIAFHDIVEGAEGSVGGVPKFWSEIKQTRRFTEFVKDWNQGGWGIGVLPGN